MIKFLANAGAGPTLVKAGKITAYLVSQVNHSYTGGFGMDGVVMRVERRMPSVPPATPYTLISAGDGANTESFAVQWDGTLQSKPLAGIGTRPLYADENGSITTNGTPPPSGWSLTGNAGTNPATNFIGTTDDKPLIFRTGTGGIQRMKIMEDGNIQIGATYYSPATTYQGLPDGLTCRVSVDGQIVAKEYLCKVNTWSDFVFSSNYNLRSLQEVETFIKENGHLPEIPNESAVKDNGLNLGEMQAKLLQKVEELTLHLIAMEKKNNVLQDRINHLEKR